MILNPMLPKKLLSLSLVMMSLSFVACQQKESEITPKKESDTTQSAQPEQQKQPVEDKTIVAIWAKPYHLEGVNKELCHPETEDEVAACTIYDLQSVNTNMEWINQYYTADIKKNYATAFSAKNSVKLEGEAAERKYYEGVMVSFIHQRYNLATFSYFNNSYSGGAHNIFHLQYDVFDLNTQKKLSLKDILKPNAKAKLIALIKQQNVEQLTEYGTDLTALELSENFYFSEEGIVFVYSLYEIAPFIAGMPRFTIHYENLAGLIKDEYLPTQPDNSLSREFS